MGDNKNDVADNIIKDMSKGIQSSDVYFAEKGSIVKALPKYALFVNSITKKKE